MTEKSRDTDPSPPHESLTNPSRSTQGTPPADSTRAQAGWLEDYPWATFVLPLAVFMLVGSFEPAPEKPFQRFGLSIDFSAYPLVYAAKIALALVAIAAVWPGYRQFSFRVSPLSAAVGVFGVVLWIGLCKLQLESKVLEPLGLGGVIDLGRRAGFDPLAHWPDAPLRAYGFLTLRLFGLVAVVPLIEEFFLRGFVMRFVVAADWPKVPFGTLTPAAIAAGTLVPVLMHPAEMFAAAAWFSLVTWLMARTRNIWDCVLAHAVTNLLLGVYVVASGEWQFM